MPRHHWTRVVNAALAFGVVLPCGSAFAISQSETSHETAAVMKTAPERVRRDTIDSIELRQNDITNDFAEVNGAEDIAAANMEMQLRDGLPTAEVIPQTAVAPMGRQALVDKALERAPQTQEQRSGFRKVLAGVASIFKGEDAGLRFDQAFRSANNDRVPEAAAAFLRDPVRGSEEYAKVSRAVSLALSHGDPELDIDAEFMFNDLSSKGMRPSIKIETGGGNEYVRTTGDDRENAGQPRQIIIGQGALSNWTDKALAAAIVFGYAYHFYWDDTPASAERTYKAMSTAVRHFINISGQSHGGMADSDESRWSWTSDDSHGSNGKPFWLSITSRWHDGLSTEARDVRAGTLFLRNIMQGWGDPIVSVNDSRNRLTLSQRFQREPSWGSAVRAWEQQTGKAWRQVISDAQNAFDTFVKNEFDWFMKFKARRP